MPLFKYLAKRAALAFLVVSGSFAFIYSLAATVGDPLAEIRLSNPPNLEYLLLAATRELRLDQSIPERFFGWYSDVIVSIFTLDFSLGSTLAGRPVTEGLLRGIAPTFILVTVSIAFAISFGSILGIFVALRRLSIRETVISTLLFLGYVAPVFWVGHLFKQYVVLLANDSSEVFRDWYRPAALLVGSIIFITLSILSFLSFSSWQDKNSRKRYLLLLSLGLISSSFFINFGSLSGSYARINLFLVSTLFIWVLLWWLFGVGLPKRVTLGFCFGLSWLIGILVQKLLWILPDYMLRDEISGRPFPSFAYESVWYTPPEFWILQLDRALHIFLPAFAIAITTVAIYYQVVKNAAIEALESDYVRMARAKGISEVEVLVRHVFRNCYLSLTNTFVPNYLYLLNGVIIVELVFGWQGLGTYLLSSMFDYDLNKLMGGIFVMGAATFVTMLATDLMIHRIDPRIREFR